jgi:tRNA(fMet)-specific endonuclease VapC
MAFLVDTNIAIHARDGHEGVLRHFAREVGKISLSAISLAELQRGLHAPDGRGPLRLARLNVLLQTMTVTEFGADAAAAYGGILAARDWSRSRDFDCLIAGHALSLGATLVTANERDFRDIPGLMVENWLDAA